MADAHDVDALISILLSGKYLSEAQVRWLCESVAQVLASLPNVLELQSPISIAGDIHGQLFDLKELFKFGGDVPHTQFLFLGDYVDRGYYSLNTFLWLAALKLRHPDRVHLLRGNHEARQITQVYGFYDECLSAYGSADVWTECTNVFDLLPLAAMVDGKVFAVHGGLSPAMQNVSAIADINRQQEVPSDGVLSDLLWSDPSPTVRGWSVSPRGAGFVFGRQVAEEFNRNNGLCSIVRAHQLVMKGYEELWEAAVVTVWSAPNYCYRAGNMASVMALDTDGERKYSVFAAAPDSDRPIPKQRMFPDYFL